VAITDREGVVSVQQGFGFVTIEANPSSDAVVAEITALGYTSTPMGRSLGYSKQSVALLPNACKLVLWVDDPSDITELQSLLGDNESVCPVNFSNSKEREIEHR